MATSTTMRQSDEFEIRKLIENWAIWRDAGDWDRFATVWRPDGRMMATWFQASASEFIERSRRAFDGGLQVLHSLGGTSIDLAGERAVTQTKMQIMQRAPVHGVVVDVTCFGRFYDLLEKVDGEWGMAFRQPIYELDHLVIVDPTASLSLDAELLGSFPEGYRHLAYLQAGLGLDVRHDCPGTRGPAVDALYRLGARWLAGEVIDLENSYSEAPV